MKGIFVENCIGSSWKKLSLYNIHKFYSTISQQILEITRPGVAVGF